MKKLLVRAVALLAVVTSVLAASPAPTQAADHLSETYCISGSSHWDGWYNHGSNSGNWCGAPEHGQFQTAMWDGSSNGRCVSAFTSPSLTGGWSGVLGSTACGVGVVKISGWRNYPVARIAMGEHSPGGTIYTLYVIYRCDWQSPEFECP